MKLLDQDFAIALSLVLFTAALAGCRNSNRPAPINVDKTKKILLRFNPDTATVYHYNIVSEATIDGKDQIRFRYSRTISLGVNLKFDRGSNGDFALEMTFSRVYISMTQGDSTEIDDADVAKSSRSVIGRIMVALKDASFFATLGPAGEIEGEAGYAETVNRALEGVELGEAEKKDVKTWDEIFRRGGIEKDLNYLTQILPNSMVWQGAQWKQQLMERGEVTYGLENVLQLDSIDKGIAVIHSEGKVDTAETDVKLAIKASIHASQDAIYQVDTRNGMPTSAKIIVLAEESFQGQGHEQEIHMLTKTRITEKK
jgi:Family of unknown function (DUF6263)